MCVFLILGMIFDIFAPKSDLFVLGTHQTSGKEPCGEVVVSNASAQAIRRAQMAFAGAAEAMGLSDEDDVQILVDEVRYGKE